jgi:sulfur relay (sulfurtransferase) DsrF/TusC family protein
MSNIHTKFKPHRNELNDEGEKRVVLDQPKRRYHALGQNDIFYVFKLNAYYHEDGVQVSDEMIAELGLKSTQEIEEAVQAEAATMLKNKENVNMYKLYKKHASVVLKSPEAIQKRIDATYRSEADKVLDRLARARS